MQQHKRAIPIADLLHHIEQTHSVFINIEKMLAGHNQDNRQVKNFRSIVQSCIDHGNAILTREAD